MNIIKGILEKISPILLVIFFWFVGIICLYPIKIISERSPHILLIIVGGLFFISIIFFLKIQKNIFFKLIVFFLRFLQFGVSLFFLIVFLIALSYGLWIKSSLAFFFFIGLLCVRIGYENS